MKLRLNSNHIVWLLIALSVAMTLSVFGYRTYQKNHPDPLEKVGVGITGYNFTNEGVEEFYVNGAYGSNLPPYGGGGKMSCCVSVPQQWSPNLTVTVDWTIGHYTKPYEERKQLSVSEDIKKNWVQRTLSKTVPIERYDRPSNVQVFFLPNDEIKVYSSSIGLGDHDEHPSGMRSPRAPNKPKEPQQ